MKTTGYMCLADSWPDVNTVFKPIPLCKVSKWRALWASVCTLATNYSIDKCSWMQSTDWIPVCIFRARPSLLRKHNGWGEAEQEWVLTKQLCFLLFAHWYFLPDAGILLCNAIFTAKGGSVHFCKTHTFACLQLHIQFCAYNLVRFMLKNILVSMMKSSCFGLKYNMTYWSLGM